MVAVVAREFEAVGHVVVDGMLAVVGGYKPSWGQHGDHMVVDREVVSGDVDQVEESTSLAEHHWIEVQQGHVEKVVLWEMVVVLEEKEALLVTEVDLVGKVVLSTSNYGSSHVEIEEDDHNYSSSVFRVARPIGVDLRHTSVVLRLLPSAFQRCFGVFRGQFQVQTPRGHQSLTMPEIR